MNGVTCLKTPLRVRCCSTVGECPEIRACHLKYRFRCLSATTRVYRRQLVSRQLVSNKITNNQSCIRRGNYSLFARKCSQTAATCSPILGFDPASPPRFPLVSLPISQLLPPPSMAAVGRTFYSNCCHSRVNAYMICAAIESRNAAPGAGKTEYLLNFQCEAKIGYLDSLPLRQSNSR
jgi:hypothetical protein